MEKSLRSKVIRLAYAHPDLRPQLLPILKSASGHWVNLSRGDHEKYLSAVWEMYEATYAHIGLIVSNPHGLEEYDIWSVYTDGETPIAFSLAKTTPHGIKSGLLGSNGSTEGKSAVKAYLSKVYHQPGRYSEVSHSVERIALASGAPVVCTVYVPDVLGGKRITPMGDGMHYKRSLTGVGPVEKIMVGNPRGIPTTSSRAPQCPVPDRASEHETRVAEGGSDSDHAEHLACMIDWEEG